MRFLVAILVVLLAHNWCFAEDAPVLRLAQYDQVELAFDNAQGGWYITVPAHTVPAHQYTDEQKRFINRTIHRMPTGVCNKEVP